MSAVGLVVAVGFLVLAMVIGAVKTRQDMECEAIAAGVAEYYLDGNHERQFRYFTNCVKEAK